MENPEKDTPEDVNIDPESTPPPVPRPEDHQSDLRDIVHGLQSRIDDLQEQVSALVSVETGGDSKPHARPWTHKKLF